MYEKQMNAIVECRRLVAGSNDGHEQAVLDVIVDCQAAMEEEREGAIGEWEQRELDYARVAVHDGFLRLALVAAEKALIVSQLPRDEYEYGLNYGRPQ
ncbi:hypothetical protein QZM82_35275 [Burkholderia cepacia]|uniref:hypothetical protein n=1 Tax=Burkholderia cepacia TaxID=292 RepID=UPI00264C628B|nr:hypothetical protein [Burkholderia cepacia]MDN7901465.1 hypothetical protein [Burkholderia cepacia]